MDIRVAPGSHSTEAAGICSVEQLLHYSHHFVFSWLNISVYKCFLCLQWISNWTTRNVLRLHWKTQTYWTWSKSACRQHLTEAWTYLGTMVLMFRTHTSLLPTWSSLLSFENRDALAVAGGMHEFWFSTSYCIIAFIFFWTALVLVIFLREGKRCNQVLCCSFQSVFNATAFCGCSVYPNNQLNLVGEYGNPQISSCSLFFIGACLFS